MKDMINHPPHYASGRIEVIEALEDWQLGFHRGNAVKYIARAGKKDPTKEIEDLEKSVWYLKREIERLSAIKEKREPIRPNSMNPTKDNISATPASISALHAHPVATAKIAIEQGKAVLTIPPLDQETNQLEFEIGKEPWRELQNAPHWVLAGTWEKIYHVSETEVFGFVPDQYAQRLIKDTIIPGQSGKWKGPL